MRTLLVSPFAPYRDGIATYAVQELRKLRQRGLTVDVLSPLPSAARWHLPLGNAVAMGRLVQKAAEYDRVILQFGPEMLFGRCRSTPERVAVWAGLSALAKIRPLDVRIHEIEYAPLADHGVERRVAKLALAGASRVTVHTEAERNALLDLLGPSVDVELIDHGRNFRPAVRRTMEEARSDLGLDTASHIFLAIGFLQHHKGFDIAVDSIERLASIGRGLANSSEPAELHIVGSARVDHPDINDYVDSLRMDCSRVPNAFLHERFVSDLEFDLWIQAADTVVLPYREIWSSGVLERARMFEKPVIASDLPQLREQAGTNTLYFDGPEELVHAMNARLEAVGSTADVLAAPEPPALPAGTEKVDRGWRVDAAAPNRAAIQGQIEDRARLDSLDEIGRMLPVLATGGLSTSDGALDPLLALGPLDRPRPVSARPGVSSAKRVLNRMMAWQIDPLAQRLEDLQRAATEAIARLEEIEKVPVSQREQQLALGSGDDIVELAPIGESPDVEDPIR